MANTVIQLKYSSTPGNIPAGLANGEIALNYADGKFYYKNVTGQIVSFSGSGNVFSFATINANNSLITALSNNSILSIRPGDNIGITGDIINDVVTISADLTAANAWSNTKLSNGTVTLAGTLTTTGQIFANQQVTIYPLGGMEGGQIDILGSESYPDWSIDSYGNALRFFTLNSGIQQITFFNADAGSVRMGVGTGNPQYAVDVNGDVNITGTYRVNGTPIATGSVDLTPANNYTNTSVSAANSYAGSMANSVNSYTSVTYSTLTQFGSVFTVANAAFDKANNISRLSNNSNYLTLDASGVTTFPGGASLISDTYGSYLTASTSKAINLKSNNSANYVQAADDGIHIFTNNIAYRFDFGLDGGLSFPDSTVQYTAYKNIVFDTANAAFNKANAANVLAYNTGIGANAYAVTVGTSANNYAGAMANASNAYAASLTPDLSPAFNKANDAYTQANAAYSHANDVATSANAYSVSVGASGNAYVNISTGAANAYSIVVGAASNAYTNTVGTSANNYAGATANSVNAYTSATYSTINEFGSLFGVANAGFTVANAAYSQANTLKTSANAYADLVGTSANNYAGVMANASNAYAASLTPDLSPVFIVANGAFDKANSANVLAYNTGIGANAFATAIGTAGNVYAETVGTSSNNYANNTFVKLTATSQTITGDFNITGNLFIGGNTTAVSANNLVINDPLIYLANNNITDTLDIGFIGSYYNVSSAHVHTGLVRDHVTKSYYLFQGYDGNPDIANDITPYSNNMVNATLVADFSTSNLTLGGANAIIWISAAYDKANAANVLAYNTGIGANAFSTAVGTAGNAYADVVGVSSNNYAGVMANSVNAYTSSTYATQTTVATNATSANNYAGAMANSANAYAASLTPDLSPVFIVANGAFDKANAANVLAYNTGIGANSYSDSILVTSTNYTNTSVSSANNYAGFMANASNAYAASLTPDLSPVFVVANGAFDKANSANVLAKAAYDFANTLGGGGVTVSNTAPALPADGDLWWNTEYGRLLIYYTDANSSQWVDATTAATAARVSMGESSPSGSVDGQLWWNTTYGRLLIYYDDGTSSQWVDASPGESLISLKNLANSAFDKANSAFNNANSAFDKANSANVLAFNTGIGANNYSNTLLITARSYTNTSVSSANNYSNATFGTVTNTTAAFAKANAALANTSDVHFNGNLFFPSGNIAVGRTTAGYAVDVVGTVNASALLVNGAALSSGSPTVNIISTNTNAVKGNHYVVAIGGLTITLPSGPAAGDTINITDISSSKNTIVARNGANIMFLSEDMLINMNNPILTLVYANTLFGWVFR